MLKETIIFEDEWPGLVVLILILMEHAQRGTINEVTNTFVLS